MPSFLSWKESKTNKTKSKTKNKTKTKKKPKTNKKTKENKKNKTGNKQTNKQTKNVLYHYDNRSTQSEWINRLQTVTPNGFNIKLNQFQNISCI